MKKLLLALLFCLASALPALADTYAGPTTFTAAGTLILGTTNGGTVIVTATGSPSGAAFTIQGSSDASSVAPASATWTALPACPVGGGAAVTSISGTGKWAVNVAGMTRVQVNLSALSGGSIIFTMEGGPAVNCQTGAGGSVTLPPSFFGSGSVSHSAVTTAYTAGELFALNTTGNAAPTQITVTATAGGSGFITHAILRDSGTGATAPPGYTIYLFKAAPTTTGLVDRSAYVAPYAADYTGSAYLGSLSCSAFAKTNDSTAQWQSECSSSNLFLGALPFQALSGQTYVDALFAVNGAYTPISGETLTLLVETTRDQ